MTDGNVSCPSCKATSRYNLVEVWNEYKLFECSLCLVQFWYPTKHPGSKYYENNLLYTLFDMDYNLSWYHKQFMKDKPGLKENKRRLIDVGCGNGKFIYEAQKVGYDVYGIDINSRSIQIAKMRFALKNVFCARVEDFVRTTKEKFDVVTFFEVLEHVESPSDFMDSVREICEGYIALSVPRLGANKILGEGDYPPNHLTRWRKEAILNLIERKGFEVKKFIIKPLLEDDIANYLSNKIRFGLIRKKLSRVSDSKFEGESYGEISRGFSKIKLMLKLRKFLLYSFAYVLKLYLFPLRMKGAQFYILAKKK